MKWEYKDDFLRDHVYIIGEGTADNPDVTSDNEPELPDSEESEYPFEDDEDLSEFIGG